MKKNCYIILLLMTWNGIVSCTKSNTPKSFDNDPVATKTLQDLTQAPWKETAIAYANYDGSWTAKPLPEAVASETTVFKTDGTYAVYNTDGSVNGTGTYDIIGDNTQLALNKTITYTFSLLNTTTMQLTLTGQMPYTDPTSGAVSTYYGMRQTFTH